jgi:hypothetical protein
LAPHAETPELQNWKAVELVMASAFRIRPRVTCELSSKFKSTFHCLVSLSTSKTHMITPKENTLCLQSRATSQRNLWQAWPHANSLLRQQIHQ